MRRHKQHRFRLALVSAGLLLTAAAPNAAAAAKVVGIAIAKSDNHIYAWFDDGMVVSGHSDDFEFYRHAAPYQLPPGKLPSNIISMSIGAGDLVYAWYDDGSFSIGSSTNLAGSFAPAPFTRATGKTIAGIGIAGSNNHVYAWYSDGTVSEGIANTLDFYRAPFAYQLPPGLTPADIIDLDIAKDDHVYAWYRNGTATSGTSGVLDKYLAPFGYLANHVLSRFWKFPTPTEQKAMDRNQQQAALDDDDYLAAGRKGEKLPEVPGPFHPPPPNPGTTPVDGLTSAPATPLPSTPAPIVSDADTIDPMIAAGKNYLIASDTTGIWFMDKLGHILGSVSTAGFFGGFAAANEPDGTFNFSNVNRNMGFSQDCLSFPITDGDHFCMSPFYDTRVYFDAASQRFFIIAANRNEIWSSYSPDFAQENPGKCGFYQINPGGISFKIYMSDHGLCNLMRRYVAFAVSKTENPQDGFYQYMLVDNQPSDWPAMSIHGSRVVISHHGASPEPPDWPVAIPVAEVFDATALANGNTHPPHFRYFPQDLAGVTAVLPPGQQGDSGTLTWMISVGKGRLHMFAIPPGTDSWSSPALLQTSIDLGANPPGQLNSVFRNGKLYLLGDPTVETDDVLSRHSIQVVRIPVTLSVGGANGSLTASTNPALGFLNQTFGDRAATDGSSDRFSYEKAAIAVNSNGDMLIGYRRNPYASLHPLSPEARYSLWRAGDSMPLGSALLRAGEGPATAKVDYTTVVVDPADDTSFWVALPFAIDKGRYERVIGHIVPPTGPGMN